MMIRHPFFWILELNASDHFAMIGIARDDTIFSRLGFTQCFRAKEQTKITLSSHSSVTDDAFFIDDRFYFCIEINGRLVGAENKNACDENKSKEKQKDLMYFSGKHGLV